jgi:hypothetical protein
MLLGCSLKQGGYISISGIWGFISKAREPIRAVFEDESSGLYFYMKDKGKNWSLFKALCPALEEFEFWDENEVRMGTVEQERYLYENGFFYEQYSSQIHALQNAGLKEVEVAKSTGTNFPPSFTGDKYLYGSLVLSLPMPNDLQARYKELITKENNL